VQNAELAQRVNHRLHAVLVGCDSEHPKCFPSKLPLFTRLGLPSSRKWRE
jgi:hypothetical protein